MARLMPLTALTEGVPYIPGSDEVVITDDHSLDDVLRFCVEQVDLEEVETLVRMMRDEIEGADG